VKWGAFRRERGKKIKCTLHFHSEQGFSLGIVLLTKRIPSIHRGREEDPGNPEGRDLALLGLSLPAKRWTLSQATDRYFYSISELPYSIGEAWKAYLKKRIQCLVSTRARFRAAASKNPLKEGLSPFEQYGF